jgi:hypothetical protein
MFRKTALITGLTGLLGWTTCLGAGTAHAAVDIGEIPADRLPPARRRVPRRVRRRALPVYHAASMENGVVT